jgi:hypothetical protein
MCFAAHASFPPSLVAPFCSASLGSFFVVNAEVVQKLGFSV